MLLIVGLKQSQNEDFISVSAAVEKVKKVNFHFSRPDNIFVLDPKKVNQFSLFHFFHFFTFFKQLEDGYLLNRSIFGERKKVKKEKSKFSLFLQQILTLCGRPFLGHTYRYVLGKVENLTSIASEFTRKPIHF